MERIGWRDALDRLDLIAALLPFDPHVAGTPPLGLDLPSSDIDVLCHVVDGAAFTDCLWSYGSPQSDFRIHQWTGDERAIVASFRAFEWTIEVFGSPRPVERQRGWRHFEIERRLLVAGGDRLRECVMAFRRGGMKTEPAFAAVLGLSGDPYEALLQLASMPAADLDRLVADALTAGSGGLDRDD
ncbi:MAG: DUF4269 domain-containing protein [Reyranella sp.]|nr:DUF4269 domain-containing protein [Reyranella sp.]